MYLILSSVIISYGISIAMFAFCMLSRCPSNNPFYIEFNIYTAWGTIIIRSR